MPDLQNIFNPLTLGEAEVETLATRVCEVLSEMPPFGSPENLDALQAAYRQGVHLAALIQLPPDTPPH